MKLGLYLEKIQSTMPRIVLFVIMAVVFSYLLDLRLLIWERVPWNVYLTVIDTKIKFNSITCTSCYASLYKCELATGSNAYWINGWYMQSWGTDIIFDSEGRKVCEVRPTFSECRGGCPELYVDCPKLEGCKKIN